jgi:hypothetical protein
MTSLSGTEDGVPDGRFRVADLMVSLIDADSRSPARTHGLMTPTGRLSTVYGTNSKLLLLTAALALSALHFT